MRMSLAMPAIRELEAQGYCIATQPIVHGDIENIPKVAGFELLARRQNANGTVSLPGEFLPEMNQRKLATLDAFVLIEAINHAVGASTSSPYYSFNTSFRNLSDRDFTEFMIERLSLIGPDERARLMIEVTDGHLACTRGGSSRWRIVKRVLGRVSDLGVRVAIDNFDHNSNQMPLISEVSVSAVKLSRAALKNQSSSGEVMDHEVLRSIVQSMVFWGCDVIADGMESMAQVSAAKRLGANFFQGCLFAEPLIAEDLPNTPSYLNAIPVS